MKMSYDERKSLIQKLENPEKKFGVFDEKNNIFYRPV